MWQVASYLSVHYVPIDSIHQVSSDQSVSLYAPSGGGDQSVYCVTKWQMQVTKVFFASDQVTSDQVSSD